MWGVNSPFCRQRNLWIQRFVSGCYEPFEGVNSNQCYGVLVIETVVGAALGRINEAENYSGLVLTGWVALMGTCAVSLLRFGQRNGQPVGWTRWLGRTVSLFSVNAVASFGGALMGTVLLQRGTSLKDTPPTLMHPGTNEIPP